jgi:tryptophan synthase alpha subunit
LPSWTSFEQRPSLNLYAIHFENKPSLIAYVTCGDPDLATTRDIILTAILTLE